MINVLNKKVGKNFHIGKGSTINCESFEVGDFCYIGSNVRITCKEFKAGDYLFIKDNAEIGHGGQFNDTSKLTMGNGVFLGERATINTARDITIGDEVGIGDDAKIWTHGSYLNILDGFPAKFDSVKIGSNVWIQAMSHIMPGVEVLDNTVILCGSILINSIPKGCLVGGNPAKIIKKNIYPKNISLEDKVNIINNLTKDWLTTLDNKKTNVKFNSFRIYTKNDITQIYFKSSKNHEVLLKVDLNNRKTFEYSAEEKLIEDYRDFLRRNGIRFMTNKPFKSIKTKWA
jgi:acetyltransferase-like isoleucine patch superfamily enzyme